MSDSTWGVGWWLRFSGTAGIRTIDQVISRHPQLDHVGDLIRHFIAKNCWGSGETREESFYR